MVTSRATGKERAIKHNGHRKQVHINVARRESPPQTASLQLTIWTVTPYAKKIIITQQPTIISRNMAGVNPPPPPLQALFTHILYQCTCTSGPPTTPKSQLDKMTIIKGTQLYQGHTALYTVIPTCTCTLLGLTEIYSIFGEGSLEGEVIWPIWCDLFDSN